MFLLSYAPSWLLALDKTTENFLAAWDAGGSCQGAIRTCRRKCTPRPTTHHPSSASQATSVQEVRSVPLVASGENGSDLEAGTLHCAAGDLASVASGTFPLVLEAQVKG